MAAWKVSLGDTASPALHVAVDPTNSQHLYIAGSFNSSAVRALAGVVTTGAAENPTLLRIDAATGRRLWAARGVPNPTAIAMDPFGFIYLTGSFTGTLSSLGPSAARLTALTNSDMYLVKLLPTAPANANGTLGAVALARGYNGKTAGAGRYAATDLAVDGQASVYIAGTYIAGPLNIEDVPILLPSPGATFTDGFAGRFFMVRACWTGSCFCLCVRSTDGRGASTHAWRASHSSIHSFIRLRALPPTTTARASHPRALAAPHDPAHGAAALPQPDPGPHSADANALHDADALALPPSGDASDGSAHRGAAYALSVCLFVCLSVSSVCVVNQIKSNQVSLPI